jgi:type I restriction enzyme R subunit
LNQLATEQGQGSAWTRFFQNWKPEQLADIAGKHGLETSALQAFVDAIMQRMIFDGEHLTDLLAPLGLNWKQRRQKELTLMEELIPVLHKLAQGREISGLEAYEQ